MNTFFLVVLNLSRVDWQVIDQAFSSSAAERARREAAEARRKELLMRVRERMAADSARDAFAAWKSALAKANLEDDKSFLRRLRSLDEDKVSFARAGKFVLTISPSWPTAKHPALVFPYFCYSSFCLDSCVNVSYLL